MGIQCGEIEEIQLKTPWGLFALDKRRVLQGVERRIYSFGAWCANRPAKWWYVPFSIH